ncbi:hypothetical protein K523DRAFT_376698 [Schizophyllum commune Tattone D]|nr:hypothetical protein K525DRAFT_214843 [Schizophyllum commune Loenen D]KAI5823129.1 hypothetical protein K523DRAFT_376698 [Schizophyllum commune Tattone D]
MSNHDCVWRFRCVIPSKISVHPLIYSRLNAQELVELREALDIPEEFKTTGRYVFSGLEALCLLLARFRSAGDMYELSMKYARSQASISECINELVIWLDERWEHILYFDYEHLLRPSALAEYAAAIHEKGAPPASVFAFIDCTIRQIARPTWHQQQAYNGHKKYHALKYQALMLPNGIIGHLYGPWEGRRNDNALLAGSGLMERLERFAIREDVPEDAPIEERFLQIFGDPAYGLGPHILSPFAGPGVRTKEQQAWNAMMSKVRITVENGFGNITNLFPFLNAGWKMHLYSSPVGRYYRIGVLLANCIDCLHPNQVAQYFDCCPPTLEEYLHDFTT